VALSLANLDDRTRHSMLEEVLMDIERKALYLSKRLNDNGIAKYPEILRRAIDRGNDSTFADELQSGYMNTTEERKKPSGGFTSVRVPSNAHEMLAEGEYNRFYVRALCRRAIQEGTSLVIYRAKPVSNPRPESELKIGQTVDPQRLLEDLRNNVGIDTALGIPAGPNSGLSVKL
jgi:hypothetical protein